MLVELYNLVLAGLDVSTAFMYAELSQKEWVLVSMPSSMKQAKLMEKDGSCYRYTRR